jgi:hypothetical protein
MNQAMSSAVHAEMEQLFGSDDAIGMRVQVEGRPEMLSMAQFRDFKTQNPQFKGDFTVEMPDGSSSVECTNYARHIKKTLAQRNVEIVGFFCSDNQDCTFTRMDLAEGHDFALVDGRFLVDPWMRLVCGYDNVPMVYDLTNQAEAQQAHHMYGVRDRWVRVES